MSMSISSAGSFNPTQMAQDFFKKADTNGDKGIDKAELKTMMTNGPNGGSGAPDVDKVFAQVDTNSDGKIDETENANQLQKIGEEMQSRRGGGGGKPSGAPPAGGPPPGRGGGGGGAGAASSSSDLSKTYEAADTNMDGTVSPEEALLYSIKHPEKSESGSSYASKSEKSDAIKAKVDDLMNQLQTSTTYTQQGSLNVSSSGTQSLFSLSA
jgi:hypothetical protein